MICGSYWVYCADRWDGWRVGEVTDYFDGTDQIVSIPGEEDGYLLTDLIRRGFGCVRIMEPPASFHGWEASDVEHMEPMQ